MKVIELIEHLKTMDQDLEVWICTDYVNDSVYHLVPDMVRLYELEDERDGSPLPCVMVGDLP